MLYENLTVNAAGHLVFAGMDTVSLAQKYGTPCYLMDEDRIREHCRAYRDGMRRQFGSDALPLFASKALSFTRIYKIMQEEGCGIDLVSPGELYTALRAGFPLENAFFHGNNKTDDDIRFAMESKVGYFVADNQEELDAIDRTAGELGLCQKVLLRLTPGIDPHTHKAISTGSLDSKFGNAIETGLAETLLRGALDKKNVCLKGFHCHIGSQIFETEPFCNAADIMLRFIAEMRGTYGFVTEMLNLGGGFGVQYTADQPHFSVEAGLAQVGRHVREACAALSLSVPRILMEPGRSMVADCGITLYTVGSVKQIEGCKNYVSVDGGMTDNPRYALYEAPYTILAADNAGGGQDGEGFCCTVAGRCCESGDLIQEKVLLPRQPQRGDILAVLTTGAYNYSMASNYNRIPRPPVVMIAGGKDTVAVKRESFEDLVRNDVV